MAGSAEERARLRSHGVIQHCDPPSNTPPWPLATIMNVGNTATMRGNLAWLVACLDRLGRYEPAATIARFALNPIATAAFPEITTAVAHLRDVVGDQTYDSLTHKGEMMTTAETYAYDQIDQTRAELNAVSK